MKFTNQSKLSCLLWISTVILLILPPNSIVPLAYIQLINTDYLVSFKNLFSFGSLFHSDLRHFVENYLAILLFLIGFYKHSKKESDLWLKTVLSLFLINSLRLFAEFMVEFLLFDATEWQVAIPILIQLIWIVWFVIILKELHKNEAPDPATHHTVSKHLRYLNLIIDTTVLFVFMFYLRHNTFVPTMLLAYFSYFILFEYLFGFTLGKLITGTRAVQENGEPLTFLKAVDRAITRLLPIDALFYLLSATCIHDKWTGTKVVVAANTKDNVNFPMLTLPLTILYLAIVAAMVFIAVLYLFPVSYI